MARLSAIVMYPGNTSVTAAQTSELPTGARRAAGQIKDAPWYLDFANIPYLTYNNDRIRAPLARTRRRRSANLAMSDQFPLLV
jgi:hypothetical protein